MSSDMEKELSKLTTSNDTPESFKVQYSGEIQLDFSNTKTLGSKVEKILSAKDEIDVYGINWVVQGKEHSIDDSGIM